MALAIVAIAWSDGSIIAVTASIAAWIDAATGRIGVWIVVEIESSAITTA